MKLREYVRVVRDDVYRLTGQDGYGVALKHAHKNLSFRYVFLMRTCRFLHDSMPLSAPLYLMVRSALRRLSLRLGIEIPPCAEIGTGFYIGHHGCIVVSPDVKFGRNCNISQGEKPAS